jgi:uncharacterized metal-binding protein YceD (DUF177 family)
MLLSIREIPEGHSILEQTVTMTEEQVQDGKICGNVQCRAVVERLDFRIFVHVEFNATVGQECSRCLKSFLMPVSGACDILLIDTDAPGGSDGEESDYQFGERDDLIDVRQSIFDEIIINDPIKPLCSSDCSGIEYQQQSAPQEPDPRWDALKKLKK